MSFEDLIYPNVQRTPWQMMPWERIAMTGLLARIRPAVALEIGVYHGASLSLTSQFADKVIGIDIDPEVPSRFDVPKNAEIHIGNSTTLIPTILSDIDLSGKALNFVLIDADHSTTGIRRDIELLLAYRPRASMVILMHDSGNPGCRAGILSADWAANKHVHMVDCDFIPGQIIEHSVVNGSGQVWGGFAIAYLDTTVRQGPLVVAQSAKTSIACLHAHHAKSA